MKNIIIEDDNFFLQKNNNYTLYKNKVLDNVKNNKNNKLKVKNDKKKNYLYLHLKIIY